MPTLWIVEGQEGVGKTTLAREIEKRAPATYIRTADIKPGLIRHDWQDNYIVAYMLAQMKPQKDVVLDRCLISGLAYMPLPAANNTTFINAWRDYLDVLAPAFRIQDIKLIHLVAPWPVRCKRGAGEHHVNDLVDEFAALAYREVKGVQFNTGQMKLEQMLQRLQLRG